MAFSVPALMALLAEIDAMSPDRDRSADGWLGDAAHAARHSDHNPEADGSVDARDFTHDPAHGVDCNLLADQIKDDPRLEGGGYIIWNRRIWNPSVSKSWRAYTGSNPHDHHMHVSVSDAGQNDTSPWLEGDDLTMADVSELIKVINEAKASNIRQHQKDRSQQAALAKAEQRVDGKEVDRIVKAIEAQDD